MLLVMLLLFCDGLDAASAGFLRRELMEAGGNSSQSVFFYIVIGLIIMACGLYNVCFKRRLEAEMLRQNLAQNEQQVYRQDVIATDEEMNDMWECEVCIFKNYQTHKTCMLCRTDKGYRLFGKNTKSVLDSNTSNEHVQELSIHGLNTLQQHNTRMSIGEEGNATPRTRKKTRELALKRLRNLNPRQKQARRRHQWVRQFKDGGDVVWTRNSELIDNKIQKKQHSRRSKTTNNAIPESKPNIAAYTNSSTVKLINTSGLRLPDRDSNVDDDGLFHQNIKSSSHSTRDSSSSIRDSSSSIGSVQSVGYISKIVCSPNNPEGRMIFESADEPNPTVVYKNNPSRFTKEELQQVSKLNFQQKNAWFVQHTAHLEIPWEFGHMLIEVERNNALHNSCEQLLWATHDQLHQSLRIKFTNEPGVDAGGLEREWFSLLTNEIFDECTGLFLSTLSENAYMINPASYKASEDHLMYFQAIGRFLGRALFEGVLIEAHFAIPMYKHILGVPITFSDLQFLDVELYRNLKWVKDNTGVEALSLDFSVVGPRYNNKTEIIDLIPNGRNIPVTDENKEEFVNLRFKYVMVTSISKQLASLVKGVYSVIPRDLLSVFDYQELELLLSGIPEIDVNDWRAHTTLVGCTQNEDCMKVINWFWDVVALFSIEEKARLLQFITGSSRVPVQGFKALTMNDGRICNFAIQVIKQEECMYPRAHTCFNRLDLPIYDTKADLEAAMKMVIKMEVTGFTME